MSLEDYNSGFCVLKFGATWCGPCKALEPNIKKLEAEYSNILFIGVNVDDRPELAKKYRIRSLPTVILLKDGREVNRIDGAALITPLRKAFRDFVGDRAA